MALEPKDRGLVAIGASIGAGCSPCLEPPIAAGRSAGLTEPRTARAVEVAEDAHRVALKPLPRHGRDLVHGMQPLARADPGTWPRPARADVVMALGESLATSHLLQQQVTSACDRGLKVDHVRSAIKMAKTAQQNASDTTAMKSALIIEAAADNTATV